MRAIPFGCLALAVSLIGVPVLLPPAIAHAVAVPETQPNSLPPFTFGDAYTPSQHVLSIVTGDFNNDGFADMILLEAYYAMGIWLNDGTGHFVHASEVGIGDIPIQAVTGDFNHDGNLDIVICCYWDMLVLLGNGDGTFQYSRWSMSFRGPRLHAVAVGDLDDNGWPEFVVSWPSDAVMTFNYTNPHWRGSYYFLQSEVEGVAIADFDGDGHPDIAVGHDSRSIVIHRGQGDGTFPTGYVIPAATTPAELAAADFNGDGKPDLLVTNSVMAQQLINNGDGKSFKVGETFYGGPVLTTGDVDGDGRMDFATSLLADRIQVQFGGSPVPSEQISENLFTPGAYSWGAPDAAMAIADVDNDGLPDLIVAGMQSPSGSSRAVLTVYRHLTPRRLAGLLEIPFSPIEGAWAITLPDGRPGLMTRAAGKASAMEADDKGQLGTPFAFPTGDSAAIIDLDHDGMPDVVFDHGTTLEAQLSTGKTVRLLKPPVGTIRGFGNFYDEGGLDVLIDLPDGGLATGMWTATGAFVSNRLEFGAATDRVVPVDIDGDGRTDLVFATSGAVANAHGRHGDKNGGPDVDSMLVYRNHGKGHYARERTYTFGASTTPDSIADLVTVDIDGDGRPDLVVRTASPDSASLWLFLADHHGRFVNSGAPLLLPTGVVSLVLADIDGDRLPDLMALIRNGEASAWLLRRNLGLGMFESPGWSHQIEPDVSTMTMGDLDRDGRPDLAFAGSGDTWAGVSVLMNGRPADAAVRSALTHGGAVQAAIESARPEVPTQAGAPRAMQRDTTGDWIDLGALLASGEGADGKTAVGIGERHAYRPLDRADSSRSALPASAKEPAEGLRLAIDGANPTPGDVSISFELPNAAPAQVQLVDVAGRCLRELRIDHPSSGVQRLSLLRRGETDSGLYWVRLTQAGRSRTVRVAVVK